MFTSPGPLCISDRCGSLEQAELGNASWKSIGIDDWINAGRWWLLRAQLDFQSTDRKNFQQGLLSLIKSSWILIDIIVRHPQYDLLQETLRLDIQMLTIVGYSCYPIILPMPYIF